MRKSTVFKYEERVEKNCFTVRKSGLEEVGKESSESQDQAEVLVLTGFNMVSSILEYEGSNFCDIYPDSVGCNL